MFFHSRSKSRARVCLAAGWVHLQARAESIFPRPMPETWQLGQRIAFPHPYNRQEIFPITLPDSAFAGLGGVLVGGAWGNIGQEVTSMISASVGARAQDAFPATGIVG